MMEIEPYDDECILTLKSELNAMRAQREQQPNPANRLCSTFPFITHHYLEILKVELNEQCSNRNFMDLFVILVNCLTNPRRSGNVVYPGIPQPIRPCELWERFAEYYLRFIKIDFLPFPSQMNVKHTGRRNDRGVDIFCQWGIHTHDRAVVQVKRGSFFKRGKGTEIILQLIGSMIIFDAKIGIVFTNESSEDDVKDDAKDIIEIAKQRHLYIHILGANQLTQYASRDAQSCKTLMVEFIGTFLR